MGQATDSPSLGSAGVGRLSVEEHGRAHLLAVREVLEERRGRRQRRHVLLKECRVWVAIVCSQSRAAVPHGVYVLPALHEAERRLHNHASGHVEDLLPLLVLAHPAPTAAAPVSALRPASFFKWGVR